MLLQKNQALYREKGVREYGDLSREMYRSIRL